MVQPLRFLKKNRITERKDFLFLQKKGKPFFCKDVIIKVLKKTSGEKRLGIVVTKKTGNAVVRARWKRVIRECFRLGLKELPENLDVVVVVKPSSQGKPEKNFANEYKQMFKKIKRVFG